GVDLAWTGPGTVFQMDLQYRLDEELITHWEFPETAHNEFFWARGQGWLHARDLYLCLRSSAPITFTHTIDGVPHTYTVASTGGSRLKQYVPLGPFKGKVFRYALDSAAGFRLYGEDCEIRMKQRNTGLGYR